MSEKSLYNISSGKGISEEEYHHKCQKTMDGIKCISTVIEEIETNSNYEDLDILKLYQNLIDILGIIIRNIERLKNNDTLTMVISDDVFYFEITIELSHDGNSIKSLRFTEKNICDL